MITVKRLREILAALPDEAVVHAYEGEGIGLIVRHNNRSGWIDTGNDDVDPSRSEQRHDLGAFI